MRHSRKRLQFNRFTSWRKATLLSLARNLIIHQQIKTTKVKASSVKPLIEKLIGMAKENTLAAKRRAYKILNDHRLVNMLFNEIGPRFKKRTGGYVRVLNLGQRRGDSAELAILELSEIKKKKVGKHKKEPKKEEEKKPLPAKEKPKEKPAEETKPKIETAVVDKEKHPKTKKPLKKFLGGIRSIFKKERDSL